MARRDTYSEPEWARRGGWSSLSSFGGYWGPLGALWGGLGALLGPSWEAIDQRSGGPDLGCPLGLSKPPLWALLGPSWGALGRSWGRLGGLLAPSWGLVGPSWGHIEAPKAHRKRNGEKAKTMYFSVGV